MHAGVDGMLTQRLDLMPVSQAANVSPYVHISQAAKLPYIHAYIGMLRHIFMGFQSARCTRGCIAADRVQPAAYAHAKHVHMQT